VPVFIKTTDEDGNKPIEVYKRLLSKDQVLKMRRVGTEVNLDLPYSFWKQVLPGFLRSFGLGTDFRFMSKIQKLTTDKISIPPINPELMDQICSQCVGKHKTCSNLHCPINYKF